MIAQIQLKEMRFFAFHGVLPQETKVGNHFVVNLTLTAPLDKAIKNDDLDSTINYATVHALVKKEMETPSKLLEHVAGRILNTLKNNFPRLTRIELSVSKLNPPVGGDIQSASVILTETYQ